MNRENMLKWILALESGEYKQTTGALTVRDEDGNESHCCLGVVCELAIKDTVHLTKEKRDKDSSVVVYDGQGDTLPLAARRWLGTEPNPIVGTRTHERKISATTANDTLGMTFEEIAAELRKEYDFLKD